MNFTCDTVVTWRPGMHSPLPVAYCDTEDECYEVMRANEFKNKCLLEGQLTASFLLLLTLLILMTLLPMQWSGDSSAETSDREVHVCICLLWQAHC